MVNFPEARHALVSAAATEGSDVASEAPDGSVADEEDSVQGSTVEGEQAEESVGAVAEPVFAPPVVAPPEEVEPAAAPRAAPRIAARHRRRAREEKPAIDRISKKQIRRLARRGGVARLSAKSCTTAKDELKLYMKKVIRDAVLYTSHARRKTVTVDDMLQALKKHGSTVYGYGRGSY